MLRLVVSMIIETREILSISYHVRRVSIGNITVTECRKLHSMYFEYFRWDNIHAQFYENPFIDFVVLSIG